MPVEEKLKELLKRYSGLTSRIHQGLLVALTMRGHINLEDILEKAQHSVAEGDPNRGLAKRWGSDERDAVHRLVRQYAAKNFTIDEIITIVESTVTTERIRTVEDLSKESRVSFELILQKLREHCKERQERIDAGETPPDEPMSVRVRLINRFVSDQLEYIGVARRYLGISDLLPIMERTIGPRNSMGRIGGKAAGIVLAQKVVNLHYEKHPPPKGFEIGLPETWFLRSDLFLDFIDQNNLAHANDLKYGPREEVREGYPMLLQVFKNGHFSTYIMGRLRALLKEIGKHPLIVRSSSLLEDNFGSAFSGKYQSIYIANQGDLEGNLHELVGAIAEVYASTLHPDPIQYRADRNLIDYDEQMGIMIQKVVGFRHGRYFLPAWSGVAFSRNEWRWTPRIKREDGLARIVLGLGTRAVDRVGHDYPRMVPLGMPDLRPEVSPRDISRYSQHYADVIDLESNHFESVPIREILEIEHFPDIQRIVSILTDGMVHMPHTRIIDQDPSQLLVTFDGLLQGSFPGVLRDILQALEQAYGWPMDVEFAFDGQKFHVLQCRPQGQRNASARVRIPAAVPEAKHLFTARKYVSAGKIENIEYVVYIDPLDYEKIENYDDLVRIGQIVSRLNRRLEEKRFILIGPGRWGSNDITLGIRVRYGDINRTLALLEMARSRGDHTPEVSFGTHFFQDLMEANIHYLPLFPDERGVTFSEAFFRKSPNLLGELLPEDGRFDSVVRVLHVPAIAGGEFLHLYMDGEKDRALAFLGREQSD